MRKKTDTRKEVKNILRINTEVDMRRNKFSEKEILNSFKWSLEFSSVVGALDCEGKETNWAVMVKLNGGKEDAP